MNQIFGLLCGKTEDFFCVKIQINWQQYISKIEFLNKNSSFTTVCRWSAKKRKKSNFCRKSCPNCNFRYCITMYSITCFEFSIFTHLGNGFERCRASELTMATRAHQCHQVLQKLSTTIALRGSQISFFTHPKRWNDDVVWTSAGRRPRRRASHIFSHFYIYCV